MTQSAQGTPPAPGFVAGSGAISAYVTPERAAVATFLLVMAIVMAGIVSSTGGQFMYSLDDPYIHLALAERIRMGHYGINLGEVTSPASSIVWPFLLVPFAGTSAGVYFPLVLNLAFGGLTAFMFGRIADGLTFEGTRDVQNIVRAVTASLLVLACNLVGLAFTGMEHNLQVLVAVAVAWALIEHSRGTPLPSWAIGLAALGPAVRYEMFAITAAVLLVLLLEKQWKRIALVGAGSLMLPAAMSLFLHLNGGSLLPNSVLIKLHQNVGGVTGSTGTSVLTTLGMWLERAVMSHGGGGRILLLGIAGTLILCWRSADQRQRTLIAAAATTCVLHFAVGQFGWFYRYELYAVAFCGVIAVVALAGQVPRAVPYLVAGAAIAYLAPLRMTPLGAANIHEQQYQMHRFVTEHYRKPFAVHDLGWVSLGLGGKVDVLDLWGLASNEAAREKDKTAAWLDAVTRRNGTGLAMIFPTAFAQVPASWRKAGALHLAGTRATTSDATVNFYATAVGDKAEITAKLKAFKPSLPPGVVLDIE